MTTPRVIAFVNGPLGDHALSLLSGHLVGIVVNQPAPYTDYLLDVNATADVLREYQPTHGVSAGYRAIIPQSVIDVFPNGIVNIHTSLLPFGRGAHPNAWAIYSGSPAGVTMHLIDEGVDSGPILHQVKVPICGNDTALTLHAALMETAKQMMTFHLPGWINSPEAYEPRPQMLPRGALVKRKRDLEGMALNGLEERPVHEVIDAIRARTFPPWPGIRYTDPSGRRYRLRIEMLEESKEDGG